MIIRSAILEGTVPTVKQASFDAYMKDTVVPAIQTYPGIRDVALKRTVQSDDTAPPVYMVFDLKFDDLAAMNAALASETRKLVRECIAKGMTDFEGRVYHVVYEIR